MTDRKPELFTTMQYAMLWIGSALLMVVNTAGYWLDLWPMTSPVWWAALVGLLGLSVFQTYEYVHERRAA